MSDETTEVLLDLLFEVDAVRGETPSMTMTRDNALLVFATLPDLRDAWLRRALASGHPRVGAVIDAWAQAGRVVNAQPARFALIGD